MTIFRCIDVETTGIPTELEKHALVEIGWCDVVVREPSENTLVLEPVSTLVNPGREIPVEAMAVHHIRDADAAGGVSPDEACRTLGSVGDYFVAHHADFERLFFGGGEKPWICTWKTALRVWPDAPGHSLQVLRYWLKLDDELLFETDLAMPPHRAGPDAYAAAYLLCRLMRVCTIEQMLKWTSGPALLAKVGFGKYFGKTWAWVGANDRGYLHWIVDKSDITDRDVRATAKFYLKPQHEGATKP